MQKHTITYPIDDIIVRVISEVDCLYELGKERSKTISLLKEFYGEEVYVFAETLLKDKPKRNLLNFVDALVRGTVVDLSMFAKAYNLDTFGGRSEIFELFTRLALRAKERANWLEAVKELKPMASTSAMELLDQKLEDVLAACNLPGMSEQVVLDSDSRKECEGLLRNMVLFWLKMGVAFQELSLQHLALNLPYYPLLLKTKDENVALYESKLEAAKKCDTYPVLFIETIDFWENANFSGFEDRPIVFFFSNKNALWHCLSVPNLAGQLIDAKNLVVVGDIYCGNEWLSKWEPSSLSGKGEAFVFSSDPAYTSDRVDDVVDALEAVLDKHNKGEDLECAEARWLQQAGTSIRNEQQANCYGKLCSPHFVKIWANEAWFNPHKGPLPDEREVKPVRDIFSELLEEGLEKEERRAFETKDKYKIMHVASQVIDGRHAPSGLLRMLVDRANREEWDMHVLVLDSGCLLPFAYPRDIYTTPTTLERGSKTLRKWKRSGIRAKVLGAKEDQYRIAADAVAYIKKKKIDILVCHGNDPTMLMLAAISDVPKKVFVEHSGLSFQKDFDLTISPLRDAEEQYAESSKQEGVPVASLPYASDSRDGWEKDPPNLKMSRDIRIMTTISNHLEARVNGDFVKALAEIMQRCPNTIYVPIGPVSNPGVFEARFAPYGLQNRVTCIGASSNPSQVCRAMHLYVNEFPFGSGIAITDAMAAGLPVVTMYDPKGVLQAQNGGNYIGVDHSITSLDPTDYVELACSLIQDPVKYKEWSEHALKRYELLGPDRYIRDFEKILKERILA